MVRGRRARERYVTGVRHRSGHPALHPDPEPDLATLRLKGAEARRGKEIFLTSDTQQGTVAAGKCNICHANAGATTSLTPGGPNSNFATGIEQLVDTPADLIDAASNPPDGGFGTAQVPGVPGFGNGTF